MIIGKLVAASTAMAGTFYVMAAAVAWFRVACPSPSTSIVASVILDRAVAWSARSSIFFVVAAVTLGLVDWTDIAVGLVLVLAAIAEFIAGLVSVRSFTLATFGHKVLVVFAAVSIAVGAAILFF